MAGPAVGTLGSIGVGTSPIGMVSDFNWSGIERPSIDVSVLGASSATATTSFGGRAFIPGKLVDPGEVTVTLLEPAQITNIDAGVITNLTITLGDGSAFTGSGFHTGASFANPLEERLEMEVTLKLTGTWVGTLSTQVP
jgi:hypothetical protein